ncbi:threonine aldolase family protein [Paenibacillus thermotolerans]|uniref:threonine aldolase family protein n=1 Tax=Paenibacillus thermotolerans TaxID=3027807 RepID=UPI002367B6BC|nr:MULTISPECIES: beta-eliminating lyase-related protein [unclassified Paenibacillus]
MSDNQLTLSEAYYASAHPLIGNGKRNVQVLKEAFDNMNGDLDSDLYGSGEMIEAFQRKMAELLGKPSAVFFPSGTMAQQIALRIWCDRRGIKKVAYHPLCHLEIHEQRGLHELHHIEAVLLGDRDRLIRLDDVLNLGEDISCLLLELPQREIGGQLPEYAELENIAAVCRERGIKLHLDGARLFEILPYYEKTATEICSLFDSVYISFYKGIGGIAGAIVAGPEDFADESKIWKRRHGGDLISLYPYIVSADYYMERRLPLMRQYYEQAKELAALYNQCFGIATRPEHPVSNMFHVHVGLSKAELEPILISVYSESGIGLTPRINETGDQSCYFEVNIGDKYSEAPKDRLHTAFRLLDQKLSKNGGV